MPTPNDFSLPRAQHGDPNDLHSLQRRSDSPGAGFFEHYALGSALLASGDLASAEAAARKSLAAAPDHPSALGWLLLAQVHAAARQLQQAWEALERGRERLPQSIAIVEAQHALAMQVGDGQLALRAAMDLRQLAPMSADAAYRFGSAALLTGLLGQARDGFAAAVALAPKAWQAHHALGKVCTVKGELDAAAAELERALELRPGQPDVSNDLAMLWVQRHAPAKAEAVLRRALQANEADEGLHLNLALVLATQGRTREALPHAEKAAAAKDPEIAEQGGRLRGQLVPGRAA